MSESRSYRRWLKPVGLGVGLLMLVFYGMGLWKLAQDSTGMENKFSALARDQHLGFLVRENLRVAASYVLLGFVAALFVAPVWSLFQKRCKGSLVREVLLALGIGVCIHVFFLLRLAQTRPYFLHENELGHWYYQMFRWFPEWLSIGVFQVVPWLAAAGVAWWHFRRGRMAMKIFMILTLLVLVSASVMMSFSGKPPAPTDGVADARPNIIIIGSDSLRGDRLGYAGYRPVRNDGAAAGGVSPNIDALAQGSIVLEKCLTPIASTLESNTTLFSSMYPHTHGFRQMYPGKVQVAKTKAVIKPIATVLKDNGYQTAAIGDWCAGFYQMVDLGFEHADVSSFDSFKVYMSQAVIIAHSLVPLYFDHAAGHVMFPEIQSFAQFVTPEVVTRRVEQRIQSAARSNQPFFWHVFYSCNHLPYRSVEPYSSMFTDPAYQGKNKSSVDFDIDEFIGGTGLEDKWNMLTKEDAQQISALYDGCTRQFDDCVGRIMKALEKNGLTGNTIVVITSDHGDDLYEPGATLGHGLAFNGGDQANHVPLVIYVPGMATASYSEIVRTIDIAPTLLDLAKVKIPSTWEGQSFYPWMTKQAAPVSRPFYGETGFPFIQFRVENITRPKLPPMDELTFIDENDDFHFVLKPEYEAPLVSAKERVLRTNDWKLIMTPKADGGRHFRLYHLPNDPHCEKNIAASHPDVLQAMRAALERWVDTGKETAIADIFPHGESR